ncbi:ABC transporter ATP-binding protein [Hydrogenoanaerobacterium sp.]|uniref:ABC transporter ATP-binding protein n=1 Tax=Hydrogenoanaerobacterium sp. TaxID=2953763 RepID=UPI00289B2205|nr:ABC transporter ATP-binding protein [Hydrogenoanaerobacterium sp.]
MSHSVIIDQVVKKYGDFLAVDHISCEIKQGEFFTLLGPSGCGKTTLLRMIAGFNSIDDGQISFDDKIINHIEAHKRDIGMVFQNYAIFPHLSVFDNVAYGLKARKIPKNEIAPKVLEALRLVQIENLKDRKPSELSGGQQQRVALARAIVIRPGVLLMDEPLSNLDAKLRVQMRTIIKKLQKELNITTVYVTHDQEEALAISDRIAIIKSGEIMQIDTPEVIYKKPQNQFVAGFIGTSNFMDGEVIKIDDNLTALVRLDAGMEFTIELKKKITGRIKISVRPEQFILEEDSDQGLSGEVTMHTFLGDFANYEIELANGQVVEANEYTKDIDFVRSKGNKIHLTFNPKQISLFNEDGTEVFS